MRQRRAVEVLQALVDAAHARAAAAGEHEAGDVAGAMACIALIRRCSSSRRGAARRHRVSGSRRRAQLGIAVGAALPDVADGGGDLARRSRRRAAAGAGRGRGWRTGRGRACLRSTGARGCSRAEGLRDAADHADLAAAVGVGPALRGLAGRAGFERRERESRRRCARTTSAEGSTSSMRQPLVAPTSMYSMKRSTTPVPGSGAPSAGSRASLVPRLTTMLTLIGPEAGGLRGVDARQHVGHREVDVVHAAEHGVVEAVEARPSRAAGRRPSAPRPCAPAASRWW